MHTSLLAPSLSFLSYIKLGFLSLTLEDILQNSLTFIAPSESHAGMTIMPISILLTYSYIYNRSYVISENIHLQ